MPNIPNISDAEWQVMQVLWEDAPLTAHDVVAALEGEVAWSPRTVKTLLNRLVKKKALGFNETGRQYSYYPIVAQEECVRAERQSFLHKVYGGAMTPMLMHFIQDVDLSKEEIDELRRMLDKKVRDRRKK
jgi:BlaI family penicillinase repressor